MVVPLGTVVPEELAFRGLLLALLARGRGVRAATLLSSGLFGLWHILPSLGGGVANATIAGAVGATPPGRCCGSPSPSSSPPRPGWCSACCAYAAAACSRPCWPTGPSTDWVSSSPRLPRCRLVVTNDRRPGRGVDRDARRPDPAPDPGPGGDAGTAEGRRRFRYTLPGAWVATAFACLAFTPSLLPRSPAFQGVVCGISAAIGYGLGVAGAWVWRAFADRDPRPPRPGAWRAFAIAAAVALLVPSAWGCGGRGSSAT